MNDKTKPTKAGWRPKEFWPAVGLSRAAGYALEPEMQPRSVKLVGARIITEQPAEYLERMATQQRLAA